MVVDGLLSIKLYLTKSSPKDRLFISLCGTIAATRAIVIEFPPKIWLGVLLADADDDDDAIYNRIYGSRRKFPQTVASSIYNKRVKQIPSWWRPCLKDLLTTSPDSKAVKMYLSQGQQHPLACPEVFKYYI
jgi:hypothetical protein